MEQRTFARIPFKTKAIVRQKDSTVIGIVENLSLAGIFLKTPERENMGMGIEFSNLDLDAFFHLRNLITYNTDKIDTVKKEFQKFVEEKDRKM
jgi:hypothetical protein